MSGVSGPCGLDDLRRFLAWGCGRISADYDEVPSEYSRVKPLLVTERKAMRTRGRNVRYVLAGLLVAAFLSPAAGTSAPTYATGRTVRQPVIAFSTGFILTSPTREPVPGGDRPP